MIKIHYINYSILEQASKSREKEGKIFQTLSRFQSRKKKKRKEKVLARFQS